MSSRAIAYVQSRQLGDSDVVRVFLALAERTQSSAYEDSPMGLELHDGEIPDLAAGLGIGADRFREILRQLRVLVPMDVLEHSDGVWEIVYGPRYTDPPPPRPARNGDTIGPNNMFTMPGWDRFSRWGLDTPLDIASHSYLFAQLYLNSDDPDATPRVWITPPTYVPTTIEQLAEAIAAGIAPYDPLGTPPELIRTWLVI